MNFLDDIDDISTTEELENFDKRRKREILQHAEDTNLEEWLLLNFQNQIMRFGLTVEMGEFSVALDEDLLIHDRARAYAKAWIMALAECWPLEESFHGIPLNPMIKAPLLKTLERTDAVEAVYLWLDCVPKHFEDMEINLALAKIDGSLLPSMSQDFLTRDHYFAAVGNCPEILAKIDNELLDKELVDYACNLVSRVIVNLDPMWQTQELVDNCLLDNFTSPDIGLIKPEYLRKETLLEALKSNCILYTNLPKDFQNDSDIIQILLENYPGNFHQVPEQFVTLEIAGKGIAHNASLAKIDFVKYNFTREQAFIQACKYNADFLNYAPAESLTEAVLSEVVNHHPLAIGYFRDGIKNIEQYYIKAVMKDALAITYVPIEKRPEVLRQAKRLAFEQDSLVNFSF